MTSQNEVEKAYKYCETITKTHAKSFYFAAKFLPKHKQKPIYALYALCRQVDDEIDEVEVSDEQAAVKAVEKWRQKLEDVFENKSLTADDSQLSTLNSQFILLAWQDLLKKYNVKQELPFDLMKGVVQDTFIKRYETFDELYVYCYRVASTVGLMASEIFGYTSEKTLQYAEALGIAMQLTNILRDVKEDAAMNRIYLPQEDLRRFNVTEEQIFANGFDKKFVEMMKFQAKRAREFYRKGEQGIEFLEKDSRFTVLLASRIYAKILTKIEDQNYNVFLKRAHTTLSQKIISVPKIWLEARKI